ncbi:MAG: PmoA family protein [Verrucomicrobiales bacterium]|nr:PmoA family protein [Verrucomicrobiales bacterium]
MSHLFIPYRRLSLAWTVMVTLTALSTISATARGIASVDIEKQQDRVTIRVDGELLTELRFADTPKPYFYPLVGPGGVPMTRNYPMRTDANDEEKDHPHHRSLWFTHGDVNGVDFWAEGPKKGRVLQEKILKAKGGKEKGVVRTANKWVTAEGKTMLTDEMTFSVHRSPLGRMFDYSITLKASAGEDLTFGDTKEGTMAVRLAESMRLKPNKHYTGKPNGRIRQDTGVTDGDTWGKRAAWTAYTGPVEGKIMTLVIFDHAANPRHPTWWHVRDYGLFAANPFGVHDFEKKPAGAGNLVIKAGDSVTFRYRFLLLSGEPDPATLSTVAAAFAKERKP